MRIIITGGTGFIGSHLARLLHKAGHEVLILTRNAAKIADVFKIPVVGVEWDAKSGEGWAHKITADTAIVNLAGAGLADKPWSKARREAIMQSRINAGQAVVEAVEAAAEKPKVVIQGSAVGYYGAKASPQGATGAEAKIDEAAPPGEGFLAEVCRKWEPSTAAVEAHGVRRAIVRTGLVLGEGGLLEKMKTPFKLGLGGWAGKGDQGMSWIHIADEVGAIKFLLEHESATGPYNCTAPNPVSAKEFAKALGERLSRPALVKAPASMLKLIMGEMADETILADQYVVPRRLLDEGYQFHYPELSQALKHIQF
jgi:uncharacterized protein (TIGR01777 family)